MSDAVATSEDGNKVVLSCQECGAVSSPIPIAPAPTDAFWCGLCGEWGFDFGLAGLTDEEMWPEKLDLIELAGPLGPDGADNPGKAVALVKIVPRWARPTNGF